MTQTTFIRAAGVSAVVSLAFLGGGAPSVSAVAPSYVALGDSFSAGVGTWLPTDPACYRSPLGYPALLAVTTGWALDYQACSGATTADVQARQLSALTPQTRFVSLTAGGNDAGFATVMTQCALPSWLSNCHGAIDTALGVVHGALPARLDTLYGAIRAKAANATVVVAGYPRLFNGVDCHPLTFFSSSEMSRINAATVEVDALIAEHAAGKGAQYVNMLAPFAGHAVCSSSPWINNLSLSVGESFHPNVAGNVAYASAVSAALSRISARTFATRLGASTALRAAPTAALPSAGRATMTAADYARALPTLASRANLAKATKAGISPTTIRRLNAALRSGKVAKARAAWNELQRLDARVSARQAR